MSSESAYPDPELTPRETEVLERLANGMSSRAIGAELRLTSNAVHACIESILLKLGSTHGSKPWLATSDRNRMRMPGSGYPPTPAGGSP